MPLKVLAPERPWVRDDRGDRAIVAGVSAQKPPRGPIDEAFAAWCQANRELLRSSRAGERQAFEAGWLAGRAALKAASIAEARDCLRQAPPGRRRLS